MPVAVKISDVAEKPQPRQESWEWGRCCLTVVACLSYLAVSSVLIVLNRNIMRKNDFPHPMFLSCMGLVGTGLLSAVSVHSGLTPLQPQHQEVLSGPVWFSRIVPVAVCKAATLAFSNGAYLFLNVGFIQMMKAFTPCIILGLLFLYGIERITSPVAICVIAISCGTAVSVSADPSINPIGLSLQLAAMWTEALSVVITQWLLQNMKFGVMEGAYVLSLPGAAVLFFAALFVEGPEVYSKSSYMVIAKKPFLFALAMSLGVAVNMLAYLIIKHAGSLTSKIIMTLRNIGLVVYGMIVFGEVVPPKEWAGYIITLIGFAGYNYCKLVLQKK